MRGHRLEDKKADAVPSPLETKIYMLSPRFDRYMIGLRQSDGLILGRPGRGDCSPRTFARSQLGSVYLCEGVDWAPCIH